MCFRCEGCQRQLPGTVGVHQRYHCSDGTRVKGTQLSGIPALLRENAVTCERKYFFPGSLFSFVLFLVLACMTPLTVSVSRWREVKGNTPLYIHLFYMRGITFVSFAYKVSVKIGTCEYLRYTKDKHQILKLLFSALI